VRIVVNDIYPTDDDNHAPQRSPEESARIGVNRQANDNYDEPEQQPREDPQASNGTP